METKHRDFVNKALDSLSETLSVQPRSLEAKDSYWQALKDYSIGQVIAVFTFLSMNYKKKGVSDFPEPATFVNSVLVANPPKETPKKWPDQIPEGPTAKIIQRILPLMPEKGKYYDDKQAAEMVRKMDEIVDEEFKKK